MRRVLLALAVAIPALGHAQISTLRYDLPLQKRLDFHLGELRGLFISPDPPWGERPRGVLSKPEIAIAARNLVQLSQAQLEDGRVPGWNEELSRKAWPKDFWILRWLREQVAPELQRLDVDLAEYDKRVDAIKEGLAKHGVIVEDPYARFSDVPKGHWADEAIHNLRRAGIIRGFPDNTFRF